LEIMDALNQGDIPDYLRVGRMVPLKKHQPKDRWRWMRSDLLLSGLIFRR
jgi:hypothetical protein